MIKAQRLYNLLMCGTLSASELDKLLERKDYLGALHALRGHEFRMADIGNNPLALDAFCRSRRAVRSLAASDSYLNYFFCSDAAYAEVMLSDIALQEERIQLRVAKDLAKLPWKSKLRSVGTAKFNHVCHATELGLYVGVGSNIAGYSEDGVNWTVSSLTGNYNCVCWSPEKAVFVAVGPSHVAKSPDGIAWTFRNSGIPSGKIYWAARHQRFIAVGSNGIATSGDAEDWATRISYAGNVLVDDGGQYVSVREQSSTAYSIFTSGDTTSWPQTSATVTQAAPLHDGCWVPERGRMVFVGNGVVLIRDGATWSLRTLPTGVQLMSVVYSPQLRALVAAGNDSIYISPDFGDTWIPGSPPQRTPPGYNLNALIWNETKRMFLCNDKYSAESLFLPDRGGA